MKMKILLIRLKPDNETIGLQHVMICEPLEFEYLIGNNDSEADIEIVDFIIEKKPLEDFIINRKLDMVVFSGYISHVNRIADSARIVKNINGNIKVFVGGVHAEVNPGDFSSGDIDFVACANGIDTFNEVVDCLIEGKSSNPEIIEGVNGLYSPGRKAVKKNTFDYKHPDRSSVSKYRDKYYYMFHNPCALIKTSFGCQYNCKFCFCKEITDGQFYQRELADIMDELESIEEQEIYIVDDNFLFDRERLLEFCDMLEARQLNKRFLVYGRADFIAGNEDVIQRFKAVGLRAVIVGIESYRENDLDHYNKNSSVEINERAIEVLKEHEVELYATLIIPLDFKKSDFRNLGKWLREKGVIFVNLQPLTPLKGTDLYEGYRKSFIIDESEYEKWDMAHVVLRPEYLSVRAFYFHLLMTYYRVIMGPKNVFKLIGRYGIKENVKMFIGSSCVSFQYVKKIIRGIG